MKKVSVGDTAPVKPSDRTGRPRMRRSVESAVPGAHAIRARTRKPPGSIEPGDLRPPSRPSRPPQASQHEERRQRDAQGELGDCRHYPALT